jgi:hypothetical protein
MPAQLASVSWSASGGGTISSAGLFTASSTQGGPYSITAMATVSSVNKNATAQVLVTNLVPGLNYAYYEGGWATVPNFSALTPIKTGTVSNFDSSIATKADSFGIRFTGSISIPTSGQYTFTTRSDDGSKLYIDNQQIVSNDGRHSAFDSSGTITLSAGMHAIELAYIEIVGGQELSVSWAGPGFSKQLIPSGVLYATSGATHSSGFYKYPINQALIRIQSGAQKLHIDVSEQGYHKVTIVSLSGAVLKTFSNNGVESYTMSTNKLAKGPYIVYINSTRRQESCMSIIR